MITPEDILNLNFYKKEKFTGSYKGMRYLIQKDYEEESDHDIFVPLTGRVPITLQSQMIP